MELYQLRTFVTVAEEGNITKAAKKLYTSQPAVSSHIKALEEELNISLFLRTSKGMKLTSAGQSLNSKAKNTLMSVSEIFEQASLFKNKLMGKVSIGLNIAPKYLKIAELCNVIKDDFPDLELHVLNKKSWEVLESIKNEQLDAGFIYQKTDQADIESVLLGRFNVLVVGPIEWNDKIRSNSLKELCKLPWIWVPNQCCYNKVINKVFKQYNIVPNKSAISDEESTMKVLASSGVGLTVMTEVEALEAEKEGLIAIRKKPISELELYFSYHKKQSNNPVIQAIIKSIKKVWNIS